MKVTRLRKKRLGKNRVIVEVPDKEILFSDEGTGGIEVTAITYDKGRLASLPELKEFGINLHLTLEETIQLEAMIKACKESRLKANRNHANFRVIKRGHHFISLDHMPLQSYN